MACDRYAVLEDDAWELRGTLDHRSDLSVARKAEPTLEWVTEMERLRPRSDGEVEGTSLRLSGHAAGVGQLQASMPGVALRPHPDDRELHVRDGFDSEPSIVVRTVGDEYTRMFLSYGLSLEELVAIEAQTRTVCIDEFETLRPLRERDGD